MQQQLLRTLTKTENLIQLRSLQTTGYLSFIQKWRKERGLPMNPTASGYLVDGPDYTYLDGRLTPYGTRQKKRILQQREILSQIHNLTAEVEFAVERHNKLQIEEENKKRDILNRKFKPKGLKLLKSK